ncbi:GMC oxidoreductase [Muricoccus aerilatus]|uniref:GMC oxidoreductase n=1 Tax=Muricoccus aerilatus TaxID=452982 RepID=UPI0005C241ED|nr:GMC family oxidoreductase [Roseomonas aerilata]
MSDARYDVIVIGSGAGGGSLALRLAPSGKRILIIERGEYLRRERDNWNPGAVFVDGKYQATETWHGADGSSFHPGLHYFVGGNTKVYGGALFRLRAEDFGEIVHADGVSPAWPLGYDAFEPYYTEAERLFHVHGLRGADPTEPPASGPYPYPPVSHEPRIQELCDALLREGRRPFPQPLAILLDEAEGRVLPHSACIRCDAFDGFPCLTNGKADAQIICIDPALRHPNVTLLTGAYVDRLETDAAGRSVTAVHVTRGGEKEVYRADIVVSACGALSSALLMLRSASDAHPRGLANGSDLVGRNYMRHNNSAFMAVSRRPNDTVFQKTMALNDFYFGADDWDYPLGGIQMLGKSHGEQVRAEVLPEFLSWLPDMPFDELARHSVDFWLMSEDLPRPENRITLGRDGRVTLAVEETNMEAHQRLKAKLEGMLDVMDVHPHLIPRSLYLGRKIPIGGTAHQAGTMRFGTDPTTSVLDLDCRAHGLDNLYVVDASFFPSIGAVNPTLTIIANALRVGDHLLGRMSAAR